MKNLSAKLAYAFSPEFTSAYSTLTVAGLMLAATLWLGFGSPVLAYAAAGACALLIVVTFFIGMSQGEVLAVSSRRAQLEEWARSAGTPVEFDRRTALVGAVVATGVLSEMERFGEEHGVEMSASPFQQDNGAPLINTDGTPMMGGAIDVSGNVYGSSGSLGGGDSFSSMSSSHDSFSGSSSSNGGMGF